MEFKLINSTHYDYLGDMLNAILFDLRTKQSLYGMDGQHKQGKKNTSIKYQHKILKYSNLLQSYFISK